MERPSANADVKNCQGIIIAIIILSRQSDPLGDVQEIWIWPYKQMVYAQPSTCPRKWHALTPMGLWHTHGSPNLGQKTRLNNNQQKEENLQNYRLCCPGWPQNKTERM